METINDIALSIKRHRELEIFSEMSNSAVGRCYVKYGNDEMQFWLINKEASPLTYKTDIVGNPLPETAFSPKTTYIGDGFNVPKNSILGGVLIKEIKGENLYKTPNGEIVIKVFNKSDYTPISGEIETAENIIIRFENESKVYSFRNISKILEINKEIELFNKKLTPKDISAEESQKILRQIKEKEKEKEELIKKIRRFVRNQALLRYQPILDPIQENIKRSKIFDGTLIIDGGPGTGKTTSLIQRIKFLISRSIEEYITLNSDQKLLLFDQNSSWIFFSPSNLLSDFLRDSMIKEGLDADRQRVKVWEQHKNELIRSYKLVSEEKRPFMFYRRDKDKNILLNDAFHINSVIENFIFFYLNYHQGILDKIIDVHVEKFDWKKIGASIKGFISNRKKFTTIGELIIFYLNLEKEYKIEANEIGKKCLILIDQTASKILGLVLKDLTRKEQIKDYLLDLKSEESIEEEDSLVLDIEDFEEQGELSHLEFEENLFRKIKSIIRKIAIKIYDKNQKLTKRDKELLILIPEAKYQEEFVEIGQKAFFKKYIERITKGVSTNIVRIIPMIYKRFRRNELLVKSSDWDCVLLEKIVKSDRNVRLHGDDQALLIYFIHYISQQIYKTSKKQFQSINHPFIQGYKNNFKAVIGVDEASDFPLVDLIAMNSLSHPDLSSVTFSGDLMQKMTKVGINSWEDILNIIENSELKSLETSYRQSSKLLNLAKLIYVKSTGHEFSYKSFIEEDESEPEPLMLVSDDEDIKIEWIADRIIEISKVYVESIPSIAIFLPLEDQLEKFAKVLGNIDALADVGILVKACRNGEVLGDKSTVRVFSVDVIKGLEFEAVFFYNFDDLLKRNISEELMQKYLYVGLSRATFYLGITLKQGLPEQLSYISDQFLSKDTTWRL